MSASTTKNVLLTAKQNLCSALSPADWKAYLGLLKQWFKRIITKETFDSEARKICAADRRCLQRHNDFLLAIFSTCQSVSTSGVALVASGVASTAPSPGAAAANAAAASGSSATLNPSAAVLKLATSSASPATESGYSAAGDGASKAIKSGSQPVSTESTGAASLTAPKPVVNMPSSSSSTPPAFSAGTPSPVPPSTSALAPPNASPSRTLSASATSPAVASPTHSSLAKTSKTRHKKEAKVKKQKTAKISFHNNFTPTNPLAYCQQIVPKPPEEEIGLSFTYRDRTLPDSSLIHGRMLVGAWDVGLEMVDEAAVRFLQVAVEMHVRSLLLKLVKDRSSFQLRDGRFPSHFSSGQRNVYSRQSGFSADSDSALAAADEDAAATFQLSSSVGVKRKCRSPVNLSDLRDSLQRNRNVVASHTVYAINMERILNSFEHQTVEAAEILEEKRKNDERKATADQRQLLTRLW